MGAADASLGGFGFLFQALGKAACHVEGEFVVKQAQGLQRRKGLVALRCALAGIRAVQGGHEGVGLGARNETVDGASVALGLSRVKLVIFVVRRVGGLLQLEQIKTRAA